jgi:demethylmenaquinone methyltransferase/2-methoxy-6-polyprenyl-1,4-benzoquinol methylase
LTTHADYMQDMFGRIARRYDLMNRLMTFGQDQRWRRDVVRQAQLPPGGWLLDIATGTGDIAFEARRQVPDLHVVAADFTIPMMRVGQQREQTLPPEQPLVAPLPANGEGQMSPQPDSPSPRVERGPGGEVNTARIAWHAADTLHLPYAADVFDAVTSGYLFRNLTDISGALAEQIRVLKPGGWLVTLDTTPPPKNLLRPFIQFHLKVVIPTLGRLVTGHGDAYAYLPASTLGFKTPDELADLMRAAGLGTVQYRRFMFDTMAVHWGQKPE